MADGNKNSEIPADTWMALLARYGAWTLLVFYLLGAIPGARSPVDRIVDGLNAAISAHDLSVGRDAAATRAIEGEILSELKAIRRCLQLNGKQGC